MNKSSSEQDTPPEASIVTKLTPEAFRRLDAGRAVIRAEYVPIIEREGNSSLRGDVQLLKNIVVREFEAVCWEFVHALSPEEFGRELHAEIGQFVCFLILRTYSTLLAPHLIEEVEQAFTFFALRANPWTQIGKDHCRSLHRYTGATVGEAIAHCGLRMEAKAFELAAQRKRGNVGTADSTDRCEAVDAYFREVFQKWGVILIRKDLWSKRYGDATQFMRWQRRDPTTNKVAEQYFNRILSEKPHLKEKPD